MPAEKLVRSVLIPAAMKVIAMAIALILGAIGTAPKPA